MKERPIIFSGEMVKAILEDRKTQTRRVVKPQPIGLPVDAYCDSYRASKVEKDKYFTFWTKDNRMCLPAGNWKNKGKETCHWVCLYGRPGDRLWVREPWRIGAWQEDNSKVAIDYKIDGYCRQEWLSVEDSELFTRLWQQSTDDANKAFGKLESYKWPPGESPCRWRSARFMPRWASRITLEIIKIRVERLQDISEGDCLKEGIKHICTDVTGQKWFGVKEFIDLETSRISPQHTFRKLWDSINGKAHLWQSNSWVWVLEFRRISDNAMAKA